MTISTTSNEPAPLDRRLNGWKEIAAHFGRGVRTVQRWEKELGLPVHRIAGGRNDSVTASTRELDEWWKGTLKKSGGSALAGEREDEERAEPEAGQASNPSSSQLISAGTASTVRGRRWLFVVAGVVAIALMSAGAWLWLWPTGNPATTKLEHGKVHVYAEDGSFLWEAATNLIGPEYGGESLVAALVRDLEGDGRTEVLVGLVGTQSGPGRLFCFDSRGRLRFVHWVEAEVRFGDKDYRGPWGLHLVQTTDLPGTTGTALWVAYNQFSYFPSVLERLDAEGKVLGRFWSDGNITDVKGFTVGDRTRILVGAANNDFRSSSLAVLDPDHPDATAPARQDEYSCKTCPDRRPLAYWVFPTTDIEQLQQSESAPRIQVSQGKGIMILLEHLATGILGPNWVGSTTYAFNAGLEPVHAVREPAFKIVYDELYRAKKLDHPFGAGEQATVWPVYRWNGRDFEEIRPR